MRPGYITLHPEHGVNPTLGICFWCGGEDGTIAMLGLNKGKKAPHKAIVSLEPCPACKANMALGITVIEATKFQKDAWQPCIAEGAYPTGRWAVAKRDAGFWNAITEPLRSQIMEQNRCVLEPELYEAFGFHKATPELPGEPT
jgi:hypothetical protein